MYMLYACIIYDMSIYISRRPTPGPRLEYTREGQKQRTIHMCVYIYICVCVLSLLLLLLLSLCVYIYIYMYTNNNIDNNNEYTRERLGHRRKVAPGIGSRRRLTLTGFQTGSGQKLVVYRSAMNSHNYAIIMP